MSTFLCNVAQTSYDGIKGILLLFQAFLLGALASAVATTITYPIQVVQTKSRVSSTILYDFNNIV